MSLGAAYIAKLDDLGFDSPDFAGLAVAISVITMLVIGPMLVVHSFVVLDSSFEIAGSDGECCCLGTGLLLTSSGEAP